MRYLKTTTSTGAPFGKLRMGRKSHHLMERVYAHLSKNGCRKSGLLADPELTVTLLYTVLYKIWRTCSKQIRERTYKDGLWV
jgi:hypothetical protein